MKIWTIIIALIAGWAAAADSANSGSAVPAPDQLTIADLRCPGAGQEYLEACRSFLNSWATDQGGNSYTSSIPILRKASQNAPSAAIKLRCLLLLAWAQFLNGSAPEANASATESLTLAKQAQPALQEIALLNNLRAYISSSPSASLPPSVRLADLEKHLGVNEDTSLLMDDLFYLGKGTYIWRWMDARRIAKVKTLLDERIMTEGKAWGISAADLEKIKPVLKKKYENQQRIDFFELAADFENECAKTLLEELLK